MNRVLTTLVVVLILSLANAPLLAADAAHSVPDYKSMTLVVEEQQFIERIWDGSGIVIVGSLQHIQGVSVSARTPLHNDGSYCTALYPGRRLVFFAHGYDPLEISKYAQIAKNVYDAGTRAFVKAEPQDTRKLRTAVSVKTRGQRTPSITCELQIRNHEYLWQDHGNRCGAPIGVTVESRGLPSGQQSTFDGLSRIPYVLVVTAPGYISKELAVDPKAIGTIDLGDISLEPAKKLRISYKARVRKDGGNWIGTDTIKSTVVSCDGNSDFRFTDQRDGLGNSLELRMKPEEDYVEASFFYFQRNSFYQLGTFRAEVMPRWNEIDTSAIKGDTKAKLQDGQLYYFTIDDINGAGIQMLFQVERE